MNYVTLLFGLSLVLGSPCSAAQETKILAFALSQNERVVAVITEAPYVLTIRDPNRHRELLLEKLEPIKDVRPNPQIYWSANSKYLAITYNESEESSAVQVVDVSNLSPMLTLPATSVAWSGNLLLIVPSYPIDETQQTAGLIRFHPRTKRQELVARDLFFTGQLMAGKSTVVARVVQHAGSGYLFSLLRVDLNTGARQMLP